MFVSRQRKQKGPKYNVTKREGAVALSRSQREFSISRTSTYVRSEHSRQRQHGHIPEKHPEEDSSHAQMQSAASSGPQFGTFLLRASRGLLRHPSTIFVDFFPWARRTIAVHAQPMEFVGWPRYRNSLTATAGATR